MKKKTKMLLAFLAGTVVTLFWGVVVMAAMIAYADCMPTLEQMLPTAVLTAVAAPTMGFCAAREIVKES